MGAAIFFTKDKASVLPVNITGQPVDLPLLTELEAANFMTIITDAQINLRDTNQFFMSFDDKIHHYYFGKGLGSISIQGLILPNCDDDGQLTGLKELFSKIELIRGSEQVISSGNKTFTGVLVDSTVTFSGEPITNAVFQLNFAVIDHTLVSNKPSNVKC